MSWWQKNERHARPGERRRNGEEVRERTPDSIFRVSDEGIGTVNCRRKSVRECGEIEKRWENRKYEGDEAKGSREQISL